MPFCRRLTGTCTGKCTGSSCGTLETLPRYRITPTQTGRQGLAELPIKGSTNANKQWPMGLTACKESCDSPLSCSLECRSGMGTAAPPPSATAVAAMPADASSVLAPWMHLERLNGYTGERTALKGKLDWQVGTLLTCMQSG